MLAPLSLTEYEAVDNVLFQSLVIAWGLKDAYGGKYIEDFKPLYNKYCTKITAHRDKYTICIVTPEADIVASMPNVIQPIPDYLRWLKTNELHHLHLSERVKIRSGLWDEMPGLFLPSTIMDFVFRLLHYSPPDDIVLLIALLVWIPPSEVIAYLKMKKDEMIATIDGDQERERWKNHLLYTDNSKNDLQQMCRKQHIPVPCGYTKHNLVKLISEKNGEDQPPPIILYAGNLQKVPQTIQALSRQSAAHLRAILHYLNFPAVGLKDEISVSIETGKNQYNVR